MWPFSKREEEKDDRPPSPGAKAIVESLANEPERWTPTADGVHLVHDQGIQVNVEKGWVSVPALAGEPDANVECLDAAIDNWVAKRLLVPAPKPEAKS